MGLGDLTDDKKTEFEEVDDEEIQELIDDVDTYMERVERLLRVIVSIDKRVEDVQDDMRQLNIRMRNIEKSMDTQPSSEEDSDDDEEDSGYAWQ